MRCEYQTSETERCQAEATHRVRLSSGPGEATPWQQLCAQHRARKVSVYSSPQMLPFRVEVEELAIQVDEVVALRVALRNMTTLPADISSGR